MDVHRSWIASVLLGTLAASAHTGPSLAQTNVGPAARATALSRAWGAVAEQKYGAADQGVEQLLTRSPMDHAALMVRLTARSAAGQTPAALDAYEDWLTRSKTEDVFLLEPIAVGTLAGLAGSPDPAVVAASLARLARYDPERARLLLPRAKAGSPALDGVAAALGDTEARARLSEALASPTSRLKLLALTQITSARIPADPARLVPLLSDPAPPVRAEAARALAATGRSSTADSVRPLLQDFDGFVRASAAVALGQLGDQEGLDALQQMLISPVGDTAVMAARVLKARGVDVSTAAERALQDANPLTRLSAIPLIQDRDLNRAADLLRQAARDQNPAIRSRAAELLEETAIDDVALLRALLRDDSPDVRISAASSLLRLAGER